MASKTGSAIDVVNAARVSMGKRISEMTAKDVDLLRYLIANEHTSPFRHVFFTFHLRLPIFVLRQWQKHQIGCAWNEQSGRYVQFDFDFAKMVFREQSPSVKQGSLGALDETTQQSAVQLYEDIMQTCHAAYRILLEMNVCKEQARAVLPLSLMTECIWSCSLHALLHFLSLRLDTHAQVEIQDFAAAVYAEAFQNDPELEKCAEMWLELSIAQRRLGQLMKAALGQ